MMAKVKISEKKKALTTGDWVFDTTEIYNNLSNG